jgi:butyrate kinase
VKNQQILVINPGSTSTKAGVYTRQGAEWETALRHSDADLERFRGWSTLAQTDYRSGLIHAALTQAGFNPKAFAAVAGRGGLLPPMQCGTYAVNDAMVEELHEARRGEHACNLGAVLARHFAEAAGVSAFVVDPVTVDEWEPVARFSGTPIIERNCIGHALNIKAVARRYAREHNQRYKDLRLIVVHLGSGITTSAHCNGRMIDQNTPDEGPFGPDRTGHLPVRPLIEACFSGRWNARQLERMAFGEGGLFAYLGTRDLQEAERRADAGDMLAAGVYDAMIYQVAKESGAMAAVLHGRVDALLLTGGMAHSVRLVERLRAYVEWIAPVSVYPGEDELRALAEGVFRVLDGEEEARIFVASECEEKHRDPLVVQGLE